MLSRILLYFPLVENILVIKWIDGDEEYGYSV